MTTNPRNRPRRALRALALLLVGLPLLAARPAPAGPIEGTPPYPPSARIAQVTIDWGTHERLAPGSDNWPLTWSADGHQYTSFGDGGGFGGTGTRGRVSLGFARVEGGASDFRGRNVWGGVGAEAPAGFTGKSRGILAIGADLYMWRCGAGSNKAAYEFQRIYKSTDNGRTWRAASWQFPGTLTFFCPAFLQYGQGYAGARDGHVYMYSTERDGGEWEVPVPGRVTLMRAPKGRLMDRAAYRFFAGRGADGAPRWSADVAEREPVFEDPNGARLPSAIYNPGLRRYFLATNFAPRGAGNMAVFDAPEPWGPWTTVLYDRAFGSGRIDPGVFYMNFAPKWWSDGGRGFVLVFTGGGSVDSWNSVRGRFATR